jgi:predicted NAD/FAD-dependent oxidoreductase
MAVIGGGVAGLVGARALHAAGHDVLVLDKGRAPAGRMATRRGGGFDFDHGAQYFTVEGERFASQVRAWEGDGVVGEWRGRLGSLTKGVFEPLGHERARYVGIPTMSAVARRLAADLRVEPGTRVDRIEPHSGGWRLFLEGGRRLGDFEVVLVTVPGPQAVPLLQAAPELAERAARARMRPCWALMVAFAEQLEVSWDGAFVQGCPLAWAARNSSKPARAHGDTWVLHASADWSEGHLEMPREAAETELLDAFSMAIDRPLPGRLFSSTQRWRFALPDPALTETCLFDADRGIGAAGDWCAGPRVEGAYLSGAALANRVLESP